MADEPWRLTLSAYRESLRGKKVDRGPKGFRYYSREGQIRSDHRRAIEDALQLGKPVPANVLAEVFKEYPDLARRYSNPGIRGRVQSYVEGRVDLAKKVLPIVAVVRPELIPVATAVQLVPTRGATNPDGQTKPKWEWTSEEWDMSPTDSMGQKQFWAKTRVEIEQEGKDAIRGARGERAAVNKLKSSKGYASWRIRSSSSQLKRDIEHEQQYYKGLLDVHKERVAEALVAGKPVPAEVLRDYPDLRKPATNPTVTQGLRSSIRDEQRAQVAYRSRRTRAARSGDKETATLYSHITGEEKHHEVEFKRRLSKVGNRNPDKEPWEMSRAARLAEADRLVAENRTVLATPSLAEGGISPAQLGMMSGRQHKQYMSNLQRKITLSAQIRRLRLSDAELGAQREFGSAASRQARIAQLTRHIADIKDSGIMSHSKSGRLKPSYQRTVDLAEAELAALLAKRNPSTKKRSRGKTTNILMTLLIMGGILYLIRRNVE